MKALLFIFIGLSLALATPRMCDHAFSGVAAPGASTAHDQMAHDHMAHHASHEDHAHHDSDNRRSGHSCPDDCSGGGDCQGCFSAPSNLTAQTALNSSHAHKLFEKRDPSPLFGKLSAFDPPPPRA